jgi:hypothetical protein
VGAEDFVKWLYTVHLGLSEETRLSIEPDNKELARHSKEHHRLCILPPLDRSNFLPLNIRTNESVLRQLAEATNRRNEVCKETNRYCQKEYEWKKTAMRSRKTKQKEIHPSIRQMLESASATESK